MPNGYPKDNRSLTTTSRTKLKQLLSRLPSETPVTIEDLARDGVSADLAVHYVRAGWLRRLARGVFIRPDSPLALDPSLVLLQRSIPGLHIGGKSALDRHGVRHFVEQQPRLRLYGLRACELPDWFASAFPAEYHRKRIFRSDADAMKHVGPVAGRAGAPSISGPERAFLEMVSEVGVRQPIAEARELAESTYTFRAAVLDELRPRQACRRADRKCREEHRTHGTHGTHGTHRYEGAVRHCFGSVIFCS